MVYKMILVNHQLTARRAHTYLLFKNNNPRYIFSGAKELKNIDVCV